MTQRNRTVIFLTDINGDFEKLKMQLQRVGVTFSELESDLDIPTFDVSVPESIEIVISGDFTDFSIMSNRPSHVLLEQNCRVLGLVSCLADRENVHVLLGASEVDAAGIIDRNDIGRIPVSPSLQDFVLQNCVEGKFSHAAHIVINSGVQASDEVYGRRIGFRMYEDFVATNAGVTFKLWQHLGAPQGADVLVDRLNSDLYRISKELLETDPEDRNKIYIPESLSASSYVQARGYSKIPSVSTAHTHEIHEQWDRVWCANPRFGQFRFNMSIFPDKSTFRGREFSYEDFQIGSESITYPGIVARLSPIISLCSQDRKAKGLDHGHVYVSGHVQPNIAREFTRADRNIGRTAHTLPSISRSFNL